MLLPECGHGVAQLAECASDYGARGRDVQAHESLALGAEHGPVVEGQACAVDKEPYQRVVGQSEPAAVEPYEERRLRAQGADGGNLPGAESDHLLDVALDVAEHLLPPRLAVAEGRDGGNGGEEVRAFELIDLEPGEELPAQRLVGDDGVGADDPGDVERFGRGAEGDAAASGGLRDRGEGDVAVSPKGHVAVYFVGDDD